MHLVIPYASALSEAGAHAAGTLSLAHLERIVGHRDPVDDDAEGLASPDEYTLSMPYERLLARLHAWPVRDGLLPWAADAARADGLDVPAGSGWALLTPAHWHVGRDQVSLLDPAHVELTEDDARVFHETLAPLFRDLGWGFHWGAARRWYASHPSLAELPTASIDRAIGRNIDLWLNDHPGILLLRRLQSEAQMLLHVHPLNEERAERGEATINSFWLSGTGAAPPPGARLPAHVRVDERLRAPALAEDWSAWAEAWQALDAGPLRELAARPDALLSLCGERVARTWRPVARRWWHAFAGARAPSAAVVLRDL